MASKSITINYHEFHSAAELSADERELIGKALEATENSYAPYSHFHVGAAVRLSSGTIVNGSNQENSAFPSGLCAERVAAFYAHSRYPDDRITALAITAVQDGVQCDDPTYPCGACRQVLNDFEQQDGKIKVILAGTKKIQVFDSVECLMPFVFDNWDGIKK
ncbi:MAG: cytidine deaminase [Bacteroidales bacterium]|jgi:cytidine deaminase|nr:cytidine deaminase [Bacteroidales bacterium]MCI2121217.1 cytidine deaminase [Bacteroidales bacterium]MCI2145993.1 cytidine deaminase [Bacteroidales bacterium]